MDIYLFILCFGFGGLLLMTLLGLSHQHSHSQDHGGHAGSAHHGSVRGTSHAAAKGGGLKGKPGHHSGRENRTAGFLLTLLSPRVVFGLLLGFGAAGVLLEPLAVRWPVILLPVLAAVAAWLFEWYLVQPLWRVLLGFASEPAQTLEHLVFEEGQAVTNFDTTGHGLIAVELDGQVRQLLGCLVPEERAASTRVRAGERLFIRAIDARRNSCTVSRLN